jgi:effector-binding domain-containing protein
LDQSLSIRRDADVRIGRKRKLAVSQAITRNQSPGIHCIVYYRGTAGASFCWLCRSRCQGEADDPFPAAAQAPPAAAPPAANSDDPFGEEVTLVEKTIIYIAGSGMWDSAFETITKGFKTVNGAMAKLGLKANGAPMTIYTATDDTGFQFQAAVPVAQAPTMPADSGVTVGKSPAGKALKFVHRGSYDAMDTTYEAITNYLD